MKKQHGNLGRKLSEETKQKMSTSHKGMRYPKETIDKFIKSKEKFKGAVRSDKLKKALSVANKNKIISNKTKQKISMANIGVAKNRNPILVDGITYSKLKDVAVIYNISNSACMYRIKSDGFPTWTR
jgi:hypothetical protein